MSKIADARARRGSIPAERYDQLIRALRPAMGGQRTREAVRAHLVDGLSVREAARRFDTSASGVSHLARRLADLDQTGCPTCGRPL